MNLHFTRDLSKVQSAAEYHALLVKLRAQKRGKPAATGHKVRRPQ